MSTSTDFKALWLKRLMLTGALLLGLLPSLTHASGAIAAAVTAQRLSAAAGKKEPSKQESTALLGLVLVTALGVAIRHGADYARYASSLQKVTELSKGHALRDLLVCLHPSRTS